MFTFELDSDAVLVGSTLECWRYSNFSITNSEDIDQIKIDDFFQTSCQIAKCMQQCRVCHHRPATYSGPYLMRRTTKLEEEWFELVKDQSSDNNNVFKLPLNENGSHCGWWVRTWTGAGGDPLVLKNAWICFNTSFFWVGNISLLQIHLFCEYQRKCYLTCNPTNGFSSAVLMRQELHVDSSYLPWNEAYKHSLSLSSILLSMLAEKTIDLSPPIYLFKDHSVQKYCVNFVACCLHAE